jgi:U3 small nucleolar RNA-associated protein 4
VDVRKSEIIGSFNLQRKADDMYSTASESPVTKMFTSYDGQWLAATNCFGDIYVFNLETQRLVIERVFLIKRNYSCTQHTTFTHSI